MEFSDPLRLQRTAEQIECIADDAGRHAAQTVLAGRGNLIGLNNQRALLQ